MKRILKSSVVPPQLQQYIASVVPGSSDDSWDAFCKFSSKAKREVQKQLYKDQRGLCAYCEIDIKPQIVRDEEGEPGNADFRVDHFHPKYDKETRSPNQCSWGLDWGNMLACCLGGDNSEIFDPERCDGRLNHHCDVKKRNKKWDQTILNPLTDVPAFPLLFDEKTCGENADRTILVANEDNCKKVNSNCYQKAQDTIHLLNLNCTVLARFRHRVIRNLDTKIRNKMKNGEKYDNALEAVMCEVFDCASPTWPPFFTTIRAHYGIAAEKRLKAINYQG